MAEAQLNSGSRYPSEPPRQSPCGDRDVGEVANLKRSYGYHVKYGPKHRPFGRAVALPEARVSFRLRRKSSK
jgi:hypothetical protein